MTTWMFQANPKRYDLLARANEGFSDDWSMNQHRSLVAIGDPIYFRISGTEAGLYVFGRVVSSVYESESNEFGRWQVDVEYEALIDPPLMKSESLADPVLAGWPPLAGQLATNFVVPELVAVRLAELTSSRLRPISKPIGAGFDQSHHEISEALERYHGKVEEDLLTLLATVPPDRFEAIVRLLLERIGYEDAIVVGKSGDGGVDVRATLRLKGVTSVPTVVQAKRWKNAVGGEIVQQLRGALRVDEHGLVITTSRFTKQAIAEAAADGKRPIGLVDGPTLVDLLIENQIGVKVKAVPLPTIDIQGLSDIPSDG
jgi:hypothetical protein